MALESPPTLASELTSLPAMSWKRFVRDLHDGRIEQICILSNVERMASEAEELKQLVTEGADALSAKSKKERFDEQSWDLLKSRPLYEVLREYKDVLQDAIPAELPQNKGVQHEIDLVPGTKYCVTRQWPLPQEEVKAIDDFFESRRKAGQVRESKSPHSAPTFCVKKAQGGWRIVHAYNKLNDATVLAQTPIPRKDVIIDSMALSTIFSALDLRDGVSSGLATYPSLGVSWGRTAYALTQERSEWPTTSNVKVLRQFLGLATYLCNYVSNYAGKIRPLSQLLRKDAAWDWAAECQQAFDAVKQGLTEAPKLAVADQDRPFHVVWYASDFAIGCALMQHDHEGRDRVVYYQSRQLKPAERNYPVHDKELLAMKYALGKFRVYLLGSRPFVVYTDHASLRMAIKSPHISLNVVADALSRRPDYAVHKADADAIGVVWTSTPSSPLFDDVRSAYANDADAKQLLNYFAAPSDKCRQKLAKHLRARVHRYRVHNGLLLYSVVDDNADRVVVPDDPE
ncbi:unnamed protein product [Phytophthora fragariaefolia]|uniref:Unnamed protein product n=1 Tax=Phytophthora fragariaefolia TaxID=1490495 RepID=A0A9W6Y6U3_9STRA|nr:unnamed protein product [Phytophthora fragariaefolia]